MREQIDYTEEITESSVTDVTNSYMQDWVFHFNPYINTWAAIHRDVYTDYWNGVMHSRILRAQHLNVLVDLLHKCKGDAEMIHEITRSSDII